MSAEDETFDIDLYGDDSDNEVAGDIDSSKVVQEQDRVTTQIHSASIHLAAADTISVTNHTTSASDKNSTRASNGVPTTSPGATDSAAPLRNLKRKANNDEDDHDAEQQDDERPLDHGAQISLKLTDLQWWTTEEDLRYFCAQSHTEAELVEVAFGEHKQNGKSKGEAYLEFKTPQAAGLAKREIEKANAELDAGGKANVAGKTKISVWYTAPGNPFRVREGQNKKDIPSKYGQQGAYTNHNRGGHAGRGRGSYNARGGSQWSNQTTNNTFNNGMMGGGFNNMGFGGFPAMAMNQNTMMSNMMGMMGMQSMMNARGGGNLNNRGGWNNGQAFPQTGYGGGAGWDSSKKARKE